MSDMAYEHLRRYFCCQFCGEIYDYAPETEEEAEAWANGDWLAPGCPSCQREEEEEAD